MSLELLRADIPSVLREQAERALESLQARREHAAHSPGRVLIVMPLFGAVLSVFNIDDVVERALATERCASRVLSVRSLRQSRQLTSAARRDVRLMAEALDEVVKLCDVHGHTEEVESFLIALMHAALLLERDRRRNWAAHDKPCVVPPPVMKRSNNDTHFSAALVRLYVPLRDTFHELLLAHLDHPSAPSLHCLRHWIEVLSSMRGDRSLTHSCDSALRDCVKGLLRATVKHQRGSNDLCAELVHLIADALQTPSLVPPVLDAISNHDNALREWLWHPDNAMHAEVLCCLTRVAPDDMMQVTLDCVLNWLESVLMALAQMRKRARRTHTAKAHLASCDMMWANVLLCVVRRLSATRGRRDAALGQQCTDLVVAFFTSCTFELACPMALCTVKEVCSIMWGATNALLFRVAPYEAALAEVLVGMEQSGDGTCVSVVEYVLDLLTLEDDGPDIKDSLLSSRLEEMPSVDEDDSMGMGTEIEGDTPHENVDWRDAEMALAASLSAADVERVSLGMGLVDARESVEAEKSVLIRKVREQMETLDQIQLTIATMESSGADNDEITQYRLLASDIAQQCESTGDELRRLESMGE